MVNIPSDARTWERTSASLLSLVRNIGWYLLGCQTNEDHIPDQSWRGVHGRRSEQRRADPHLSRRQPAGGRHSSTGCAASEPGSAPAGRRAPRDLPQSGSAGLRARNTQIVTCASLESGLPHTRLDGGLERTAWQLEAFASLVAGGDYLDACIDPLDANARPIPRPDVRRMLVPIGPVAVFGASNFPLAFSTAGGDTASALAAGCPVIVKGHPAHPGTGEIVAEVLATACRQMRMPEGTFSLLTSAGPAVGKLLVERPEIRAVAFTGSFAGRHPGRSRRRGPRFGYSKSSR